MLPGLEPLFQEIADSMVAAIPEEWSTARVEAIYFSDSSVYEAEYTRKADGVPRDFETPEQCLDAFDVRRDNDLSTPDSRCGGGPCLNSNQVDGTFRVKWGYDDCDANGDTIFDEDQELGADVATAATVDAAVTVAPSRSLGFRRLHRSGKIELNGVPSSAPRGPSCGNHPDGSRRPGRQAAPRPGPAAGGA